MISLLLHKTEAQGYHMSEWGITCLYPTEAILQRNKVCCIEVITVITTLGV